MKYIKQLAIILGAAFLGEALYALLPLPIPASIYGLLILALGLALKVIRLEQVEETADFLIQIMPLMFIPAAAGLIPAWPLLRGFLAPILTIVLITTLATMGVTGKVTEFVMSREARRK